MCVVACRVVASENRQGLGQACALFFASCPNYDPEDHWTAIDTEGEGIVGNQ